MSGEDQINREIEGKDEESLVAFDAEFAYEDLALAEEGMDDYFRNLTLEDLLEGITEENLHGEVDTGPPVGKEVW